MRLLLEFECPDGHLNEELVDSDTRHSDCETCGKPAKRIVSAPRVKLDPLSGDFPGQTAKWAKTRDKQLKREQKAIANHGPDAAWDIARG